jgi:hypothetical protein
MLDIDTIDSELRLVAALRGAARERGGPLPSIDVGDALLDKRLWVLASDGRGIYGDYTASQGKLPQRSPRSLSMIL